MNNAIFVFRFATSVILSAGSFAVAAEPGHAQSSTEGWIVVGSTAAGVYYIKPLYCEGPICHAIEKKGTIETRVISDCKAGLWKYPSVADQWFKVVNGTFGQTIHNAVCLRTPQKSTDSSPAIKQDQPREAIQSCKQKFPKGQQRKQCQKEAEEKKSI